MDRFPNEFEDLLNRRGKRLIADAPQLEMLIARRQPPIVFFEDVIDRGVAKECIRLLDESMYPRLRRMHTPIPREALTRMKRNYTDRLPKTVRVKTAMFNAGRSKQLKIAEEIGLSAMLSSGSFRRMAQAATRSPLRADWWGRQVICYEPGDYSGPHNDHHPEEPATRNGFVDIHVMFANEGVAHQMLIYEQRRFLSVAHEVTRSPSIAIYRLPFWHYTTPLLARPGHEATARRWLLLGTFDYDPPLKKLTY